MNAWGDGPSPVVVPEFRVLVAALAVTLWDLERGAQAQWAVATGYDFDRLALVPDGRRVAVVQQWEDVDRLWILTRP